MSVQRGPVERAVRSAVVPGAILLTPSQGREFVVADVDGAGVVLLLGEQHEPSPG